MYFNLIAPADAQKLLQCVLGMTVGQLPGCIFENGLIHLKCNIVNGKCKIYTEQ